MHDFTSKVVDIRRRTGVERTGLCSIKALGAVLDSKKETGTY